MISDVGDEITGRVVGSVESMGGIEDDELCELIDNIMLEEKYRAYSVKEKLELRQDIFNSIKRLDILQSLIEDDSVTEIMINGYRNIFIEREGKIERYIYEPKVRPYSERQLHNMEIKEIFDIADANSANSDSVLLPQSHNGRKLQYRIKKKNEVFRFILIIPLIIAVVIIEERSMRAGRKKKLQEELTREYPEIISKLSLLTGAGMTPYNALRRIAADGNGEAYSRLAAVVGNIQSGASERAQYASFGRIFGLEAYSRLGSMLEQNTVKGNERLRIMLREECEQALEERKARARKAGEQAGTKMLFPMMLMLLIVMAVIMVPAFWSM